MSRGVQVRETIELLCKIFKDNGMSGVEAEALRKAKFDKSDVCFPLWRLLFEMISFCQHGLMNSSIFTSFAHMKTEDQVMYVKKEMQKRGYLSRVFATLPTDMSTGSRELMLALAWLLNKEDIISKFMENRASPMDDDVVSLYESVESEEGWSQPALGDKQQSPAQRVQQMLVLNTKLKMSLRLLHSSQHEYATLTHRIHNSTYGVSLSPNMNHLTTMQVQMLRHPQHMKRVLSLLEQDSTRLEHLMQWDEKETLFWEWMESVLELKLQHVREGGDSAGADSDSVNTNTCATRTVFLEVPPTIGSDIAESRRNLMNMILHYESAIERLEDLWATKRSTVSEWELDKLLGDINTEISQLQSCLGQAPKENTVPPPGRPRLTLVKNKGGSRAPVKVSNAVAATSHGRDSAEESTVSVHDEIGRLQQEADMLEKELKDMRRDCLHKLNRIVSASPNTVCIMPPQLRKLCR
ncbi:hypothetical protein V1264_019668 [Littorina saxatilis]|uniref:Tubulin epsilon and delta complex protein 1 domain-containing protein n=1 Tax=Littorina saxatilis TaxID=31220 RepID=A0AAN9BFW8_9CAEN